MKTLVLPIAGQSTRYQGVRPKFLLVHPNGNLMITEAIKGLDLSQFDQILVIGLNSHQEQYNFKEAIIKEFTQELSLPLCKLKIVLIEPTTNQPQTVYNGLKQANINKGGILIKDCDNYFELNCNYETNFIAVSDLHKLGKVNASNKSYVNIGKNNSVTNIVEKEIIGNLFCCGGYYFEDVVDFNHYYERLNSYPNLYISHIIYNMILDGYLFLTEQTNNYIDWGTLEDWLSYTNKFKTIFIDLDGILVENSSRHIEPIWGQSNPIKENIDIINKLYDNEFAYIIITTSRLEYSQKITEAQLQILGIKYHRLIMGLPHCKRILINDYSITNPYPSAIAINIERDQPNLRNLLNE
ncbi:MAG: hypothetical protein M0R00_08815 [Candidatus Omnitrophica bacterium]|jgi:hypothetical protein|nr:hypothetical protein [Candidatus Omnitrophota bacterium]